MSLTITRYQLSLTFITSLLGTQPNKDVATEYVMAKYNNGDEPPADELATLPDQLEKGTTAFHKRDGQPIYYDYQIKGFFKEVGMVFNGLRNVKNLRSKIDNFVFISPRQIPLCPPAGAVIGYCERPLRAMTAQGPRTSVARSEELPAGTQLACLIEVYDGPITEDLLRDLLNYGERKGLGQWRNGSHGRFTYTLTQLGAE